MNLVAWMVGGLTLCGLVVYVRGWRRLRRRGSALATVYRLMVFLTAALLVGLAFLSPLNTLNHEFLFLRELQFIVVCLLAPPAYFISCAYDIMLAGLPAGTRRRLNGALQPAGQPGALLRRITPFWLLWFGFIALFLIWHDAGVANWLLGQPVLHTLSLVVLGMAALLFWWQIIGTGPRLHAALPALFYALALVLVEIANMATGVSIAFAGQPIYAHYAAVAEANPARQLTVLDDQALGGAALWVAGSLVYISSIILILNRLFQDQGGQPQAHPDWDDDDRMIMPGLEHRVRR